jgi:hypothetical protein
MLLNCKFFVEEVIPRCGEICAKPIFVFQPVKLLLLTQQGEKSSALSYDGTKSEMEAFIDMLSKKFPTDRRKEFVRDMRSNVCPVLAQKPQHPDIKPRTSMPTTLPLFMHTFRGIAYGIVDLGETETNILIIFPTRNFARMAEVLAREVEVANFPESCHVSVIRPDFRRCYDSKPVGHRIEIDLVGYEISAPLSSVSPCHELNEFSMEMFSCFFDLANAEIADK